MLVPVSRTNWTTLGRKATLRVVGLMSGTSADGIDAAVVDVSLRGVKLRAFRTYPYPPAVRREVLALCAGAGGVGDVCRMNFRLGELFAAAVLRLAEDNGVDLASVDLVGSHGQTICHLPDGSGRRGRSTLQIGEASVIAEKTGITTVADFRPRDIAAGGLGAPLVPRTDHFLFACPDRTRILCNIGGIANVTHLPAGGPADSAIAFDTGPGNMVIDELVRRFTGGRRQFDRGGRLAARGSVHECLLGELLALPYFRRRPPKTAGREQFGTAFADELLRRAKRLRLDGADLLATATALTGRSIARACKRLGRADELVLCGGGSRNATLMAMLRDAMAPTPVRIMDELGLDADAKEAVSFAILATMTVRGVAGNVPSATGAAHPALLGKIIPGAQDLGRGCHGRLPYEKFEE